MFPRPLGPGDMGRDLRVFGFCPHHFDTQETILCLTPCVPNLIGGLQSQVINILISRLESGTQTRHQVSWLLPALAEQRNLCREQEEGRTEQTGGRGSTVAGRQKRGRIKQIKMRGKGLAKKAYFVAHPVPQGVTRSPSWGDIFLI